MTRMLKVTSFHILLLVRYRIFHSIGIERRERERIETNRERYRKTIERLRPSSFYLSKSLLYNLRL